MTRDEFIEMYAAKCGLSVDEFMKHGQIALPCRCGADYCFGWSMVYLCNIGVMAGYELESMPKEYRQEIIERKRVGVSL